MPVPVTSTDRLAAGQRRLLRRFVEGVQDPELPSEFVVQIGSDRKLQRMTLFDGLEPRGNLRADGDQARAELAQARQQIALIVGKREVASGATFEAEEDQHGRTALQETTQRDTPTIDLGQIERLHLVAHLDPLGGLGVVDQRLPLLMLICNLAGSIVRTRSACRSRKI